MRHVDSWCDGFFDYTERLPSPVLFRKWAGIALIAGALERKVWIRPTHGDLFPNLYTILVAPPGVGKTILTALVSRFWRELEDCYLASSSITRAALIDELNQAVRRIVMPDRVPSVVSYNSLLMSINELGVLLPGYDTELLNTLTEIYDCHAYNERKRTKDIDIKIERPQINLLAACTPSYLKDLMPAGAWDQGFTSRTLLIYSGETVLQPLFNETSSDENLFKELVEDLETISSLYGRMSFTPEAAHAVSEWHLKGGPPKPEHPKLFHYSTRRTAHLLKLCMIASVSVSDDLTITVEHYQQALDWLLEAEHYMPDIFKAMSSGGDSRVIEDTWYFAYTTWMKDKQPIQEFRLVTFLQERVPAHNVARILEVMKSARILEEVFEAKKGKCYKPRPKQVA